MAVEAVLDHEQSTSPGTPTYRRPKVQRGWASMTPLSPTRRSLMEQQKRVSEAISTMDTAG
jgi:hypothetical protein